MKVKPLFRTIDVSGIRNEDDAELVDKASRTIEVSFSSEAPVPRWFGREILQHKTGSARLDRLNDGAPVLFNHNLHDIRGVVERAWIKGGRGYARIRLSSSEEGEKTRALINEGVLRNVSFMYRVHDWEQTKAEAEDDTIRVTDWEPLEVSLVTVPADQTVGVGRSLERDFPLDEIEVKVRQIDDPNEERVSTMKDKRTAGEQTPDNVEDQDTPEGAHKRIEAGSQGHDSELAVKRERERTEAIYKLADSNGISRDTAKGWIQRGTSFERIADDILKIRQERAEAAPESVSHLDLSRRETEGYSLCRAILAAHSGKWDKAGLELECHEAIAARTNKVPDKGAFFVPLDVQRRSLPVNSERAVKGLQIAAAQTRDLTVGTAGAGGYLVQTSVMGFDELLRNISVMFRMGATRLSGLRDSVTIPRQSAAATAEWLATEASAITESQQTFVQLSLSPKTVGAYTELSRQLLLQASIDVEGLVNSDLAAVCALAVDSAALTGDGTGGAPTGITNTSGIGAVTGTSLAYAGILDFQTDVAAANVMPIAGGYVTTPAVAALMMQRVKFSSTASPLWEGSIWGGNMAGFPAMSSNQVPSAEMIFGDWAKAVIAEWGVLEVETNPFANFPAGIIGVRAMYSVDVGIRYPAAFSAANTIT